MERNELATFKEKISPFLLQKLSWLAEKFGPNSYEYQGLARQYLKTDLEVSETAENNVKHWEADVANREISDYNLLGIERLYRRTLVIDLTLACAAHCRYCLRGLYTPHTMDQDEIIKVAKYCGNPELRDDLNEVLITGGDPFLIPNRLNFLIESLMRYAPNILIMRIATRLPQHDPNRVGNSTLEIFKNKSGIKFEIATQTNHPIEFFPEVRECFSRIMEFVPAVYSQNVLLKGVNDNLDILIELYDTMRFLGIEPHYLFHAVPLRGTHHFRTSVEKGLNLAKAISSSGVFSGRAKPQYAAMTDIGKITFYEGTILKKDEQNNRLLLQSHYKLEDRLKWNPSWQLTRTAKVNEKGYLQVWYLDGEDS
jgi:lysine 2,3-aminomutase